MFSPIKVIIRKVVRPFKIKIEDFPMVAIVTFINKLKMVNQIRDYAMLRLFFNTNLKLKSIINKVKSRLRLVLNFVDKSYTNVIAIISTRYKFSIILKTENNFIGKSLSRATLISKNKFQNLVKGIVVILFKLNEKDHLTCEQTNNLTQFEMCYREVE